jgi:hypothetical protein
MYRGGAPFIARLCGWVFLYLGCQAAMQGSGFVGRVVVGTDRVLEGPGDRGARAVQEDRGDAGVLEICANGETRL